MSQIQVQCPTCKTDVVYSTDNKFRPFCCKRCQLIDLGEWANESHVITGKPGFTDINLAMDVEEIDEMLARQEDTFFKE
jgi:endogenous inhibitor of DNA gyrase (YacG/DUF329 family)